MAMTANLNIAAPIHRLHQDLLWSIFKINADMFLDDHALKTTRLTSQVCRSWRDCMLGTPSLWGRLIDLDALYRAADNWRNELLQRSATSMLWIKAEHSITQKPGHLVLFFFDILDKQWQRIQRLVVGVNASGIHPTWWRSLYLPAPHIQIFNLNFWGVDTMETLEPSSAARLFASEAPALREFNSRAFKFNLQAHWLPGLRSLHIGSPFSLPEVMSALEMAPNLEYLRIDDVAATGDITPTLPLVRLPKLDHLKLLVGFKASIVLLEHLDVPPGCSLEHFSDNMSEDDLGEDDFKSSFQTLSKVARRYFHSHLPTKLSLEYSHTSISLKDKTCPDNFVFSMTIWCPHKFPRHAIAVLFSELALREFSQVTELQFEIVDHPPSELFMSFLARLPSIEVIQASERTIDYLLDVQDDIEVPDDEPDTIFPFLKTVKLEISDVSFFRGDEGAILEFLESRREDGYPIDVLDLTQFNEDCSPKLDFLEELTGLKVLWTRWEVKGVLEYVCGSGNPEKLPF